MRSIWKGAITFGLVNVPVKVYGATEDHDISLHQVHEADGGRIRYQRRCEIDGTIIDYADIARAYDDGERTVILTKDDLASLPEERSREIEVVEFVPSEQIDPIMLDKSYFLEPDSKSPKAYALLRKTLESTDRTAIVHFALRQKTRLGALRVRGDVLVLQALLWDDEVREAAFPALDEPTKVSSQELEMAMSLVDQFATDFAPEKFTDDYQEQLRTLIEAKLAQGDAMDTDETFGREPGEGDGGGEVLDLMEALKRSVDKSRGGGSAEKKAPEKKAPAKKSDDEDEGVTSNVKKPVAEKAPAKKAPAKKPAATKPAATKKAPAKRSTKAS
ncbi:Ku protein [Herbiconiux sp. CPCC 203407]|uniref:Non-homologous end joining protein Ku n=1 Tax=Herbiconiux oxytropis TaxID=2970915 RepID=A0AA41XGN0_9MICO|nr:Ku protein [Herbiconiux oxytropis]MCS5723274.1 Ku protein [Herbiconiux oxytropis]MCS5727816.1 Ku protein [Herbiconiux oxytropis]